MKCQGIWNTVWIAILGCVSGCGIFQASLPVAPFTMSYVGGQPDTVSPLPALRFAFSDSLTSPIDFTFSPPVAQPYQITFNAAYDTATLSFVEMLPGNTRYVLRLKNPITAQGGSTIDTGADSTVIVTGATEQEPNNSPATADTVPLSGIFGTLADASDTDVYCVPKEQKAFYVGILSGQVSFSIEDSLLQNVPVLADSAASDTFTVPAGTIFPIYVSIFAPIKGTVGFYKFGIVH